MMVTMLQMGHSGEFLVRPYSTAPSRHHFKMAIKQDTETTITYLIEPAEPPPSPPPATETSPPPPNPDSDLPVMYRLRGCEATFPTVSSLVAFYAAAEQPSLGIKLMLPRHAKYAPWVFTKNAQPEARPSPTQLAQPDEYLDCEGGAETAAAMSILEAEEYVECDGVDGSSDGKFDCDVAAADEYWVLPDSVVTLTALRVESEYLEAAAAAVEYYECLGAAGSNGSGDADDDDAALAVVPGVTSTCATAGTVLTLTARKVTRQQPSMLHSEHADGMDVGAGAGAGPGVGDGDGDGNGDVDGDVDGAGAGVDACTASDGIPIFPLTKRRLPAPIYDQDNGHGGENGGDAANTDDGMSAAAGAGEGEPGDGLLPPPPLPKRSFLRTQTLSLTPDERGIRVQSTRRVNPLFRDSKLPHAGSSSDEESVGSGAYEDMVTLRKQQHGRGGGGGSGGVDNMNSTGRPVGEGVYERADAAQSDLDDHDHHDDGDGEGGMKEARGSAESAGGGYLVPTLRKRSDDDGSSGEGAYANRDEALYGRRPSSSMIDSETAMAGTTTTQMGRDTTVAAEEEEYEGCEVQ
eukprot:gene19868-2093_t